MILSVNTCWCIWIFLMLIVSMSPLLLPILLIIPFLFKFTEPLEDHPAYSYWNHGFLLGLVLYTQLVMGAFLVIYFDNYPILSFDSNLLLYLLHFVGALFILLIFYSYFKDELDAYFIYFSSLSSFTKILYFLLAILIFSLVCFIYVSLWIHLCYLVAFYLTNWIPVVKACERQGNPTLELNYSVDLDPTFWVSTPADPSYFTRVSCHSTRWPFPPGPELFTEILESPIDQAYRYCVILPEWDVQWSTKDLDTYKNLIDFLYVSNSVNPDIRFELWVESFPYSVNPDFSINPEFLPKKKTSSNNTINPFIRSIVDSLVDSIVNNTSPASAPASSSSNSSSVNHNIDPDIRAVIDSIVDSVVNSPINNPSPAPASSSSSSSSKGLFSYFNSFFNKNSW